jgi:hypothetical protein
MRRTRARLTELASAIPTEESGPWRMAPIVAGWRLGGTWAPRARRPVKERGHQPACRDRGELQSPARQLGGVVDELRPVPRATAV